MYNQILFYTFVALMLFFLMIEIYRFKFYIKGTLVAFYPSEIGIDELISSRVQVKLDNGLVVDAEIMRCTLCLGQLAVGDEVRLMKSHNMYHVNLPLLLSKRRSCTQFDNGLLK